MYVSTLATSAPKYSEFPTMAHGSNINTVTYIYSTLTTVYVFNGFFDGINRNQKWTPKSNLQRKKTIYPDKRTGNVNILATKNYHSFRLEYQK